MPTELQNPSFWLYQDPYAPNPALDRDVHVDVAIVGGGFTGLWTAYLLLKRHPGIRLIVLESESVGYGASGRNAGFVMTLPQRAIAQIARNRGETVARQVYEAASVAVRHIGEVVALESIACDLEPNGLLTVSDCEAHDSLLLEEFQLAQRIGLKDLEFLPAHEAQKRVHSERIRGAIRDPHALQINPARLARGLKRVIESLGAEIYEETMVTSWTEASDGVSIETERGTVQAERALLAQNAWSAHWKPTRNWMLPFYTYVCLTTPLTEEQWGSVGWKMREGVEDRRTLMHYMRPTPDGRILFGGRDAVYQPRGPHPRFDQDAHVFARLRESFEDYFPQIRDLPFEYRWGGPISVTPDGLPRVGFFDSIKQRAAFAFGYNGHGVTLSHVAAHTVVDLFSSKGSSWTELPFVENRPRALGPHFVRDRVVRATVRRRLQADDEGRIPRDPWSLRLIAR